MFWGLIMEPNKRYTQTVEKPFHISQAAMDTSTGDNEICQVMVVADGKNFLICSLQKNKTIQVPLDLYFKTGNVVSFLTNGKSNVHLTGYLDPEFDEEDESMEEEDEEEAPELVPAKGKRKMENDIQSESKKLKKEAKKLLQAKAEESDEEDEEEEEDGDDDDDDDDSSEGDDLQKLLDGDADSDENDESFRLNSTADGSDEDESEDEDGDATMDTTSGADTSREEPKKLSKSQKRRLKKQQKKAEQPQTNGVEKKAKKEKEQPKQKEGKKESAENKQAAVEKREKKTLAGGVLIEDLKVGSGPVAKFGKDVEVYYEGRLKSSNKMFDSCNKGPGFKFRVGNKEVIAGWDVGLTGMKVGGKRKIVCPPAMAYGNKGSPPVIPPNSTLVFEVELRKVK